MKDHIVEACVEQICNKGCREVRKDIERMESGGIPPEVGSLSSQQRELVLKELQTIMAVYGSECRI